MHAGTISPVPLGSRAQLMRAARLPSRGDPVGSDTTFQRDCGVQSRICLQRKAIRKIGGEPPFI